MTDNEIKKALEEHYKQVKKGYADHLAYGGKNDEHEEKYIYMLQNVLDLINRQNEEYENLKAEVETELDKLNAEKNDVMYYRAQIKAEAHKEFVERLKNEIDTRTTLSKEQDKNVLFYIDNLYKELVGKKL